MTAIEIVKICIQVNTERYEIVYSIHVVIRFTHAYRDIVADNDYAIFIQIAGLFECQRLKNVFLMSHVLRNWWFINNLKTDKKTFAAEYW